MGGRCPYFDNRDICLNPVLSIDENGMCQMFWFKGNLNPKYKGGDGQMMNERKEEIIIEAEFEDV